MLPKVRGDRIAKFEEALRAPVVFDFYGLERGGHNAVLQWILERGPQPHMQITLANTNRPNTMLYTNGGWFVNCPPPKSVAISYGPDVDLECATSHISHKAVIIAIRDIRNTLASRLKWIAREERPIFRTDTTFSHLWSKYAKQTLGIVDYFNGCCVGIVYDRWFASSSYRLKVLQDLNSRFGWNLILDNKPSKSVTEMGDGSSFDGMDFRDAAHAMDVLNRWQHYADHPLMTTLLTPEIKELNGRLIEGV